MKREYRVDFTEATTRSVLELMIRERGDEGWEMVFVVLGKIYWKRETEEPTT
jgi:hypothetical protein